MAKRLDAGDVIIQEATDIGKGEDSSALDGRMSKLAPACLLKAIDMLESGKAIFAAQDEKEATYAPKLSKKDGMINWGLSAADILNMIRGLQPWPGAFTYLHDKTVKIFKARLDSDTETAGSPPGAVIEAGTGPYIKVSTGKGVLAITELQPEGKRRMTARQFLAGNRLKTGDRLGG
jgi:methionyl-tRNA formyltransferase